MATLTTTNDEVLVDANGVTLADGTLVKIIKINGKTVNRFATRILKSFAGTVASSVTLKERLSTPTISLSDSTITINGTSDTTTYVYINGEQRATTTDTTYDLSSLETEAGTYVVKVLQKKSGYIDSLFSSPVNWVIQSQLDAPTNLSSSGNDIIFDKAENATTYEVLANDTSIGESAGEAYSGYVYTQEDDTVTLSNAPYTQEDDTVTIQ